MGVAYSDPFDSPFVQFDNPWNMNVEDPVFMRFRITVRKVESDRKE